MKKNFISASHLVMLKANLFRGIIAIALLCAFVSPSKLSAQGSFIFSTECNSGNFWSTNLLTFPTLIINNIVTGGQGGGGGFATHRFNRIKVNGQKVDYDGNHYFGFKAVDLFRDFEYSLKLGWQPVVIPVGFYARVGFRHENFETRLSGADEWTKHRINYLRPGIGIRISPLDNLIDEYDLCPIVEIGSTYDYYLSYKGAYGSDKNQLNNGMSLCIGIGAKFESGAALMLTFDRQNYDLFNKDFTVDGMKPYENTKTNHFNISLSMTLGL